MKKLKLLWRILKTTDVDKFLIGFTGFLLLCSFVFMVVEPGVEHYGDGLWYAFTVFTTIGFGDIVATTTIGRLLTMLLGLYGILIVALIPGVLVNYYSEMSKMKANSSVAEFLDKLEHLSELPKKELDKISLAVKKKRYKL